MNSALCVNVNGGLPVSITRPATGSGRRSTNPRCLVWKITNILDQTFLDQNEFGTFLIRTIQIQNPQNRQAGYVVTIKPWYSNSNLEPVIIVSQATPAMLAYS